MITKNALIYIWKATELVLTFNTKVFPIVE